MRQQILVLSVLGALTSGALTACDRAPLEFAVPLSGTYELQQANGAPLPFLLSSDASERYELVSEVLVFDPEGKVLRERRIRRTDLATGHDTIDAHSFQQEYRVRGDLLEIGSFHPCPPNANCVGNDIGTVIEPQIELQSSLYGRGIERPRLLYLRQ